MKPLEEATLAQGFTWKPEPLVLGLTDVAKSLASTPDSADALGADEIEGGLIGLMNWQWLRIEILVVPARYSGQGFSSQ